MSRASGLNYQPQMSLKTQISSTTTTDLSRGKHDGTLSGTTVTQLPSGLWVYSFDGENDFISLGTQAVFKGNAYEFTFLHWVKWEIAANQPTVRFCNTMGINHSGTTGITCQIEKSYGGADQTYFHIGYGAPNPYSLYYDKNTYPVLDNTWHLLGVTKSVTSGMAIYYDASIASSNATFTTAISYGDTGQIWYLGRGTQSDRLGKGLMGEVRVYNRTLSQAEIYRYYQMTRNLYGV